MVTIEGVGKVAPPVVLIPMPSESERRQFRAWARYRFDQKYGGSSDKWKIGKGEQGIYEGLVGEWAFCKYLTRTGIEHTWRPGYLPRGGDRWDIKARGWTFDVKTGQPLVRSLHSRVLVFVFADLRTESIALRGYVLRHAVEKIPLHESKKYPGTWNHRVQATDMLPMSDLPRILKTPILRDGDGIIRYPGGKGRLFDQIRARFPQELLSPLFARGEYREPFVGAGSVVLRMLHPRVLPRRCPVWINDMDQGLVALWSCIKDSVSDLCTKVAEYTPSVEGFYAAKQLDASPNGASPIERAFAKVVLHQTGFSGLGFMAGGPLGGRDQTNAAYPVDCRWNAARLVSKLRAANRRMSDMKVTITQGDFAALLAPGGFVYLDPPYYEAGPGLYRHSFTDEDHVRLRDLLAQRGDWLLSYDEHPRIRELYRGFRIETADASYTVSRKRKHHELLIRPT